MFPATKDTNSRGMSTPWRTASLVPTWRMASDQTGLHLVKGSTEGIRTN